VNTSTSSPYSDNSLQATSAIPWTQGQKAGFRFIFLFFLLFIFIQNNDAYPFWDLVTKYQEHALHVIIPWIGKNILHIPYDINVFTNGSGDTTYDYVLVFLFLCISVVGTVVWTLADRKRPSYNMLYYWLTVVIRFYIGLMLIDYGFMKIFRQQFLSPSLYRLTEPYGDSSPMGLAWTFFGFSKGYNLFIGIVEVSSVLLLFRKTVTLGAILTLGTTINIMAVNYFFDVPVKIISTTLVLMTIFLIAPDAGRLFRFFIKHEAVKLEPIAGPVIEKRWLRITMASFKYILIGYTLLYGGYEYFESMKKRNSLPSLYGLYEVKDFTVSHYTSSPLPADYTRWDQMMIEWEGYARVVYMKDSSSYYLTKIDTTLQTVDLTLEDDTTLQCHFKYENPDGKLFAMRGTIGKDSVAISFDRYTDFKDRFSLTRRKFHWINEYPPNW